MAFRDVTLTDPAGRSISSADPRITVERVVGWDRTATSETEVVKRIGHGTISGPTRRNGVSYVIEGVTSDLPSEDAVKAEIGRIKGFFAELGEGVLSVDGREAAVRLDGQILADDVHGRFGWVRWSVSLYSDDPYRYGPARSVNVSMQTAGTGMSFPMSFPMSFGSFVDASVVLTNQGSVPAYPVITVYIDDPAGFALDLGGRVVEVEYPVSPSAPVTVDMRGKVTASGGGNITSAAIRKEWGSVPGGGSATLTLTSRQGVPGYAVASIRDTYI